MAVRPKHFLKNITIDEASLVDDGDNPGAAVAFFKRRPESGTTGEDGIRKGAGAMDFDQALAAAEVRQRLDKFWPMWGALSDSLSSILSDSSVSNKGAAFKASIAQFTSQVQSIVTDIDELTSDDDEDVAKSAGSASSMIEDHMATLEELTARVEAAEGAVAVEKKRADDAEAEVVVQKARADAAEGEVTELKKARPEGEDPEEAEFIKAFPKEQHDAARASFRKLNARTLALESTIRKQNDEREDEVEITKAKALDLPGDMNVVGQAMRLIRKANPELAGKVETVLKGAGAAIKESKLLKSAGTADGGGSGSEDLAENDPEREVLAKAAEIKKAKPSLTDEQAYVEALDSSPELYGRVQKFRRSGGK